MRTERVDFFSTCLDLFWPKYEGFSFLFQWIFIQVTNYTTTNIISLNHTVSLKIVSIMTVKLGSRVVHLICRKRTIVQFKFSPLDVSTKTVLHCNEQNKICVWCRICEKQSILISKYIYIVLSLNNQEELSRIL